MPHHDLPAGAAERISGGLQLITKLQRQVRREALQRHSILFSHTGFNILLGYLLLTAPVIKFATPAWIWLQVIPGHQVTLGTLFLAGGMLLAFGVLCRIPLMRGWRHYLVGYWLQIYGLLLIMIGDLCLGIGFTYAHFARTDGPQLYPIAVYLNLAVLMVLHLTMIHFYTTSGITSWDAEDDALIFSIRYDDRDNTVARTFRLVQTAAAFDESTAATAAFAQEDPHVS